MKHIKFILLLLALSAYYRGSAFVCTDNPPKDNPAFDQPMLDTVLRIETAIITARRRPSGVIPAQVLEGDELRRLSVVSVADAIRYFSGTQIKDYGGIGGLKTVNIRSMGTQHVGVFYDGVQLGNAQNGQTDLGRFSMDNMEAISLYNGQKSNIFQTAKDFASAGSIYLTTRRPEFEEGKRNNLRLALSGGSFWTVNPSVLWEHRLGNKLDASLNAEYLYTSGRYKFRERVEGGYDTTEVRRNGDTRALRVEGGLWGTVNNGDWKAKVYLYDSERGYPGAAVGNPGHFRHISRQWDRNFFAQSSLRRYYGIYSLMLNIKYANDYMRYLANPKGDDPEMFVDNSFYQHEAYFSAANEFRILDWWRVSLSSDFHYNTLDANLVDFAYPTRYTVLVAAATAVEFKRVKLQGSLLYTYVDDQTKTEGGSAGNKSEWTPTIVAMYKPFANADLSVRAFYKKIFRMPTFNDLYYTSIGNKYLDPEYTTQYNLGLAHTVDFHGRLLRRLDVQVDAYYNEVKDKIIAYPSGGGSLYRWTMINMGMVEIRGLSTSLQGIGRFGKAEGRLRLNYTYEKAQDFTDPHDEYYGGYIPYAPVHSGSAIAGVIWGDWDLNYSFIYTGERYWSRANIRRNYIKPWYTSDLSLSRTIPCRRSELRFTLEVNNIFNQQYDVVLNYPMPGTNFRLKINWTL